MRYTLSALVLALIVVGFAGAQSQQPSSRQSKQSSGGRQPDRKSQETQRNTNAEQRGSEETPFVIKVLPPDQAKTNPSNNEEKREEKSTEDWRLSEKIAAIAIAVGVLQFLALFFTVLVMVRTARRQLRAYVSLESASLCDGTMLTPPQPARANQPGIVGIIKNTGQTPAYALLSWANIEVTQPINESNLVVPALGAVFSHTLGSNQHTSKPIWFSRTLTANEIADIASGAQAIYYFGRIEYMDAFKKKRFTIFRLRYQGQFPPVPGAILFFCERGNEAN